MHSLSRTVRPAMALVTAMAMAMLLSGPADAAQAGFTPPPGFTGPYPVKVNQQRTPRGPSKVAAQPKVTQNCANTRAHLADYKRQGRQKVLCVDTLKSPQGADAAKITQLTRQPRTREGKTDGPVANAISCAGLDRDVWWYTRFDECTVTRLTSAVIDVNTGETYAEAFWDVSIDVETWESEPWWDAGVALRFVDGSGDLTGWQANAVSPSCQIPCTLPGGPTAWGGLRPIGYGDILDGNIEYESVPDPEATMGFTFGVQFYNSIVNDSQLDMLGGDPLPLRCDVVLGFPGRCVIPNYTPTYDVRTSQSHASAVMIDFAQYQLNDGWGLRTALNRLANKDVQNFNRSIACDSTFVRMPDLVPDDSCDEFAFAATYQSAAQLGYPSGIFCTEALPRKEGGIWVVYLNSDWSPSDPCIRGHVTLADNEDVGARLGGFTTQQRLLNQDPYFVNVIFDDNN